MNKTILGWSWGTSVPRYHDPTGISHLIVVKDERGVAACSSKRTVSGGVEKHPPCQPCKICLKIEKKMQKVKE